MSTGNQQFQFKTTIYDIGLIIGETETIWEETGYTNRDQAIGHVRKLEKEYAIYGPTFHFTVLVRGFVPIQYPEVPFEGDREALDAFLQSPPTTDNLFTDDDDEDDLKHHPF